MNVPSTELDQVLDHLLALPSASHLEFLAQYQLVSCSTVEQLDSAVGRLVRVNLKKAQSLAQTALVVANQLGDEESRAYALRAKANALWFMGESKEASELHMQVIELFRHADKPIEIGRTLSTSIQPLILLGEYDRAHAAADEARKIFAETGETARLARLEINQGNIFHRQDRFVPALECYRRAFSQLHCSNDQEGIIAALHNIGVCSTMLNDYEGAEAAYAELRNFCAGRDVPLAVAQADYNIAYLHYLRGEYGRAIAMLRATREMSHKVGDAYHAALCELDLSEIFLELNLHRDADELAQSVFRQFKQMGMMYEAAKALCQSAIALSQQGKGLRAVQFFEQARVMFAREGNKVWSSLIDLYQALTYFREGRLEEARRYCVTALEFFRNSPLPGKAILCRLLLARLSLKAGQTNTAREECQAAIQNCTGKEPPILAYQAHMVMGQIEEKSRRMEEAKGHYRTAKEVLETLRSGLYGEELKISFLENKMEVYENLVNLCLVPGLTMEARAEVWMCMEQAKSRGLLELVGRGVRSTRLDRSRHSEVTRRALNLREQLNWYYHRIELEQLTSTPSGNDRLCELRGLANQCEKEFVRRLRNLPCEEAEAAGLDVLKPAPFEAICQVLGRDATLIEYFRVGDRIVAGIVTHNGLEAVSVAVASRVARVWRFLQLQLSKFYLGQDYVQKFQEQLLKTTQCHLQELYRELIEPISGYLQGRHLIVVPHEFLHQVPFHALFDGERYLMDSFTISYSPSASIYLECRQKQTNTAGPSLILGVPDPRTPSIYEELQSVATILPKAKLFLGRNASEQALREHGPQSRLIHIAAHGVFRRDNPAFSGVRLGDGLLTLYDLYGMRLPVDLVTLSGCSTGLNAIAAGDELIGLMRGLLFAGARSLLLTLWDVNDKSTAAFMRAFYKRSFEFPDRALAIRGAMQEIREGYPHPYYWAPFALAGSVSA